MGTLVWLTIKNWAKTGWLLEDLPGVMVLGMVGEKESKEFAQLDDDYDLSIHKICTRTHTHTYLCMHVCIESFVDFKSVKKYSLRRYLKWFEKRSDIKFLLAEKCKPCEIYRRMSILLNFSWVFFSTLIFLSTTNSIIPTSNLMITL